MAAKLKVIGGPLDGLRQKEGVRRIGRRGDFAWINAGGAVSPNPGPGRLLYRRARLRHEHVNEQGKRVAMPEEVYVFAGDTHAACECGGTYRKAEGGQERQPCANCGSTIARSSA